MQTARLSANLLRVGKYKERGCWVHFQRDWCLYSALFPSWSFWEMVSGSGQEQYLWVPEYWAYSFVSWCTLRTSCLLWFVRSFGMCCTCSVQWPERGPGLTCQDLKNSNLKNIVKNKYLGGGRCSFFFHEQVVCWRVRWFAVFKLLLWHSQS